MRRTRQRLCEMIRSLNEGPVPRKTIFTLMIAVAAMSYGYGPPSKTGVANIRRLMKDKSTSWYIKDLCQDTLWHLDNYPWWGPKGEIHGC